MPRLIDADKVAEAIAWLNEYDYVIWHDVQECIDKLPTVDSKPVRHGHWIEHTWVLSSTTGTVKGGYSYECSVCGGTFGRKSDAYCYKCGAKMDDEKEDGHGVG